VLIATLGAALQLLILAMTRTGAFFCHRDLDLGNKEIEKKKGKRGRKVMKKRKRFSIRLIIDHFVDNVTF
jgi:hypothetical protein